MADSRHAASVRRLKVQASSSNRPHTHSIEWHDEPIPAGMIFKHNIRLPNLVKLAGNCGEGTLSDNVYVLHTKRIYDAFSVKADVIEHHGAPSTPQDGFFLSIDYDGVFQVLHDTECVFSVADLARILPKQARIKSNVKNITTTAKQFHFDIGKIIYIHMVSYGATKCGVKQFLRCSFRGNIFFTLNLDCIGDFEILPDSQQYTLRYIETRYPTPVRVQLCKENGTNHDKLLAKSNSGNFILENISHDEYIAGNCNADDSVIIFSARSNVTFYTTKALFRNEPDNRFMVNQYGKSCYPCKLELAKIVGLQRHSFVMMKMNLYETSIFSGDYSTVM